MAKDPAEIVTAEFILSEFSDVKIPARMSIESTCLKKLLLSRSWR